MTWIGEKRNQDFMILLNDFSFLKINGFEKPMSEASGGA
jgi:hypothetical protein